MPRHDRATARPTAAQKRRERRRRAADLDDRDRQRALRSLPGWRARRRVRRDIDDLTLGSGQHLTDRQADDEHDGPTPTTRGGWRRAHPACERCDEPTVEIARPVPGLDPEAASPYLALCASHYDARGDALRAFKFSGTTTAPAQQRRQHVA